MLSLALCIRCTLDKGTLRTYPSFRVPTDVEVDYEFHNDAAFVQVELSIEDEDVEKTKT